MLDSYVKNPINQEVITNKPGEIVIVDNLRILHGRNAFRDKMGEERWLMRAWYDATSDFMQENSTGFR